MNRFPVLYVGPATPPDASHEGWPEWFAKLGDRLVDRGSPIVEGRALHDDGSTGDAAAQLNGYSIIQAGDVDEALRLIGDHPYLAEGREYSVEIYLLPRPRIHRVGGARVTHVSIVISIDVLEVTGDVDVAAGVAGAQGRRVRRADQRP